MKSAAYHGPHGKGDHVTFIKGQDPRAESSVCDRVYVTTLFSVEYRKIGETIDYALKLVGGRADRVFVGGIAASLMTERFKTEARWRGVRGGRDDDLAGRQGADRPDRKSTRLNSSH